LCFENPVGSVDPDRLWAVGGAVQGMGSGGARASASSETIPLL
jgi:hypothetical protein